MLETIRIEEKLLAKNDLLAAQNRQRLEAAGLFVLTLAGSPGGGKTSLLERSVPRLAARLRVGVVEGDIETDRDGQRIAALDVPVAQIVTNGTCHLDAGMVSKALDRLPLTELDLLFVENVGNLVCPASYALGEHLRIVVMSTTEGEDKPLKYPAMFRQAEALVLNKVDLLPYVPVKAEDVEQYARRVQPGLRVFRTSCVTGDGIEEWIEWVSERRQSWRRASSAT
jgi:hydrogenase nickel incorporation protein HypB